MAARVSVRIADAAPVHPKAGADAAHTRLGRPGLVVGDPRARGRCRSIHDWHDQKRRFCLTVAP